MLAVATPPWDLILRIRAQGAMEHGDDDGVVEIRASIVGTPLPRAGEIIILEGCPEDEAAVVSPAYLLPSMLTVVYADIEVPWGDFGRQVKLAREIFEVLGSDNETTGSSGEASTGEEEQAR